MSIKQIYVCSSSGTTLNINDTQYISFPDAMFRNATESVKTYPVKIDSGVSSNLCAFVTANTLSANGTIVFRKTSGDGAQSITITAGVTGRFQDNTNTDSVSVDDSISYKWNAPAGTGSATFTSITSVFSPDSNFRMYADAAGVTLTTTAQCLPISGGNFSTTDALEANAQCKFRTAGTLRNARINVTSNASTANVNLVSRVNGADGGISLNITALTTGVYLDDSGTDSISVSDLVNFRNPGTTTGNIGEQGIQVEFLASDSADNQVIGAANNTCTDGVTRYLPISNAFTSGNLTEANAQIPIDFDYTIKSLEVYVSANATTSNSTIDQRVDTGGGASSTALTATITSGTTGYFSDLTHTVTGNSGDLINTRVVNGGGGTIIYHGIGYVMRETQAAPVGRTSRLALLGVG